MASDFGSPGDSPRDALLARLADLVSKPVLVTLDSSSSGPAAVVREVLNRVETTEDYGGVVYLLFAEEFHGTRVVLPIEGLETCETDAESPGRTTLTYNDCEVELRDVSPEAIVRHYRRVARIVLRLAPGRQRRAQLAVLVVMIRADAVAIDDPLLAAELRQLIEVLERADGPRPSGEEEPRA